MIRILIADDHAIVREGLERILQKEFPSALIELVANGEELLKRVIKSKWDVVVSDLSMPGKSGLEALEEIKQIQPKLPILILTIYPEEYYALRVLKAGAAGYLNKDMASQELVNAVHRVLSGKKYITSSIAEKLVGQFDPDSNKFQHELLTTREFEVLKLIGHGKSIAEIADALSITPSTVSTFRARILAKMNLKTNAELILYTINNKIL
jgi:DNA-binding NarL/FixJ family response regulator